MVYYLKMAYAATKNISYSAGALKIAHTVATVRARIYKAEAKRGKIKRSV